jgi:hypothetical protein
MSDMDFGLSDLDMMEAYEEVGVDTVAEGLAGDVPSELSGREYIERARQARASEAEQQAALAAQIALAKEGTQLAKGEGRTPQGNPFGSIGDFITGGTHHRFGRHSSDFGIPDDEDYRDVTFGDALWTMFGLTGPIGQIKAYRMAQRANPHDARKNEMKYQDPAKMQYGRPEMYGVRQDLVKVPEYYNPDLQRPFTQPTGVEEGDFFIDTPFTPAGGNIFNYSSQFQGFHSDPTRAGFVGQHSFFTPVVAQTGGLINASSIQKLQEGGLSGAGVTGASGLSRPFGETESKEEGEEDRDKGDFELYMDEYFGMPVGLANMATGILGYGAKAGQYVGGRILDDVTKGIRDLLRSDDDATPAVDPAAVMAAQKQAQQNLQRFLTPSEPTVRFDPRQATTESPLAPFFDMPNVGLDTATGTVTIDGAPVDTIGAFNRGGAIRSGASQRSYGTMNPMNTAQGIASLGRGGDTMLVHMRPDEVAMMSRDGRTTVNPRTGLPERYLGAGLGAMLGSFATDLPMQMALSAIGSGLGSYGEQRLRGRSNRDALETGLYTGLGAGLTSGVLGQFGKAELGKDAGIMSSGAQKVLGNKYTRAGISGLAGGIVGEMGTPLAPLPAKKAEEQPLAIARPKRTRYVRDPKRYGFGSEQYQLTRNRGLFDYQFAQEGKLIEAEEETTEVMETPPLMDMPVNDIMNMPVTDVSMTEVAGEEVSPMEETMDVVTEQAVLAIRGEHPQPEVAIQEYIEVYGEEDYNTLKEMVLQDQSIENLSTASLEEEIVGTPAPDETEVTMTSEEEMSLPASVPMGHGGMLEGPGKGRDDKIPVLASDGEYVIAADVVSGIGDGSTQAGARALDAMADRVRQMRTGTPKQPEKLPEELALPA